MASHSQNVPNTGSVGSTPMPPSSTSSQLPLLSPSSTAPNVHSQSFTIQTSQQQQSVDNFEPLDKSSSNTLKRNPKMELSKADLLKLLGYLEGELQARDIVIAALKSEKMKHLLNSRYRSGTTDPQTALTRDVAIVGGVIRMESSQADRQVASLEALVTQQRRTQCRMAKVLKEAEIRHRTVIKELEEEKRKHEHDTAQGDDITYGLEKERTRLKKELELERQEKKRLELELKKESLALEMEKSRQKQIVLLLLAERKKIIMKYIEERKRSEDLAQILSEEKIRIDSMAEGLEEESKKSLQMEAELEKQLAQFDMERQQYRQALSKEEKRTKELEIEVERMKAEMETWKNGAVIRGTVRTPLGITPPPPPAKPANLASMPILRPAGAPQTLKGPAALGTGTPMVSSKVVQPTATVSSVPVSGPTTGIARSVTPRQPMRGVTYGSASVPPAVAPIPTPTTTVPNESTSTTPSLNSTTVAPTGVVNSGVVLGPPSGDETNSQLPKPQTTEKRILAQEGKVTTVTTIAVTILASPAPGAPTISGMKPGFHVTPATSGQAVTVTKKSNVPRGIPPPVPPNKPVVPPKKEAAAYMRRPDPNQQIEEIKLNKPAIASCQGTAVNQIQQPAHSISSPLPANQVVEENKPR